MRLVDPIIAELEQEAETTRRVMEFLRGLDDARASQTWTMTLAGKPIFSLPRIGLVRTIMLNHWYHHRGEM